MSLKLRLFIANFKKNMSKKWYELMKPFANYLDKRDKKKYIKLKESVTEEQAIKWIAKSIIKDVVKYNKSKKYLLIADEVYDDDRSYDCIGSFFFSSKPNKGKHKIAFHKFNRNVEFQEKVVDILKQTKGIKVEEEIEEFKWNEPENYKKTYIISIDK